MYQVSLLFVIGQYDTFIMEYDKDVKTQCPKESHCKLQFKMHLIFNAGTGDKYFGWCYLIWKGTSKSVPESEKDIWDKDVDVIWKNKAWVDSVVTRYLAHKFAAHNNKVHD